MAGGEVLTSEQMQALQAELAELEPEEAAEELARRLAEYRRMKLASAWLREQLDEQRERYFRTGPAPKARVARRCPPVRRC